MFNLPWHNIWSAGNPVSILNEHLSLLVGRIVLTRSSEFITTISLGCRPDFGFRFVFNPKWEAHLRWTRDRSRVNWVN